MYSILNSKRAFTPKKRSVLKAGLYSAVAGGALLGSEALSHTVTLNTDGTTTTGPLFGNTSGTDVPHVHPEAGNGTVSSSFTSSILAAGGSYTSCVYYLVRGLALE